MGPYAVPATEAPKLVYWLAEEPRDYRDNLAKVRAGKELGKPQFLRILALPGPCIDVWHAGKI